MVVATGRRKACFGLVWALPHTCSEISPSCSIL